MGADRGGGGEPHRDPEPGGRRPETSPDQLVEDYVASITCNPMGHCRPLWDLHILNIPTSDAAAVSVLRLHHSLGDGTSLMFLFLACICNASDPDFSLPTIPKHYLRLPPASKMLHAGAFTGLLWLSTSRTSRTPCITVNDVLVGVTSAGLSRYLIRRYVRTCHTDDDDSEKNQLPSNIRLRSTLLVNIRPIPGIHALAELTEGRDGETKWGNFIGYIILPSSIMRCKNPLDYIRRAKATADRKNSLEAIFTYKGAELIVKCFGIKAAAALCRRVLSNTALSISNMIGPVEEIVFYDHPLVYLALSVFGHPQALTVHFQSYVNTMKIVLTVDEAVIPDPYLLLDGLAESLRLITTAIPATS
ncbi:wax ester synthase/diacylglycerol acyltransferase 11-like [Musa acuminata AAA Group]|uniref:wax ester synthase/diacylglycerol acyltransferase 11-like n=1 Tax=Musa acuminata AAA Group TaxID=214697 RepID=UPI0031D1C628